MSSPSLNSTCWRLGISPPTTMPSMIDLPKFVVPKVMPTTPTSLLIQSLMANENKFKYAVVRLPETSVVDFFSLIMTKGYSDVSFVSNLNQCSLRDDPNDDPSLVSSSSGSGTQNNDDDSTSENNKSSPSHLMPSIDSSNHKKRDPFLSDRCQQSSSTPSVIASGAPLTISSPSTSSSDLFPPSASIVAPDLFCNLFGKAAEIELDASDWNETRPLKHSMPPRGSSMDVGAKFSPYSNGSNCKQQDSNVQTRMKGWQREYIKDVIINGHYPTEEELRDIEIRCDLSRKQVLRFIAKRLVNPNRKPRAHHQDDKGSKDDEEERAEIDDFSGLNELLMQNVKEENH